MFKPKDFLKAELPEHLGKIHVKAAWEEDYLGGDVGVAIVDSGIDIREGYARGHLNRLKDETTNTYYDQRVYLGGDFTSSHEYRPYVDEFGHGTKMAAIIGARPGYDGVVGIVPEVRLFNYKVANADGNIKIADLQNAVEKLLRQREEERIRVALFALDEEVWRKDPEAVQEMMKALDASGILSVVAASDSRKDLDASSTHPAGMKLPLVIVVAAHNREDSLTPDSSWGKETVHLAAPGRGVASASPMAPVPAYGTSAAAAIVAGVAALLFAKHPQRTAAWVHDHLRSLVRAVPNLQGKTVTGGALDLAKIAQIT